MRWIGLFILCIVGLLGVLSYQLFSILLQPIQTDLRLSDTTTGLINGLGIATIGAIAAFPIGWAADRYGRRLLLGLSVITWSVFAAIMGLATTQVAFTAGAVGINLGDAALIPLLYGIIATTYVGRDRIIANATMVITLTVGGSAVIAIGGLLLQLFAQQPIFDLSPWRAVCVTVALIGLISVPFLTTVPSERTAPSMSSAPPQLPSEKVYASFAQFMRIHGGTIAATFLGMTFYYIAFYTFLFWAPALLERKFGMTTAEASISLGTPLILSSIGGIIIANIALKLVEARWEERTPLRMVAAGCIISALPAASISFVPDASMFILAFALMNVGVTVSLSLAPALLQNCAPDAYRSRTIALFPIIALAVRVIFPALVPWLSDRLGGAPQTLVNINVIMFLICLLASVTILLAIENRYAKLAREFAEA